MVRYGPWIGGHKEWVRSRVRSQPLKAGVGGTEQEWAPRLRNGPIVDRLEYPPEPPIFQQPADSWRKGMRYPPWDAWDYLRQAITAVETTTYPPGGDTPHISATIEGILLQMTQPTGLHMPTLPPDAIGVEWQDGTTVQFEPGAPIRLVGEMDTYAASRPTSLPPPSFWRAGVNVIQGPNGVPEDTDMLGVYTWPGGEPKNLGRWRSQGQTFTSGSIFSFDMPLIPHSEDGYRNVIVVPTLEYVDGGSYRDTEPERVGQSATVPPFPPPVGDGYTVHRWVADLLEVETFWFGTFPTFRFVYPSSGQWPYRQRQSLGASGYPYRQRQNGGNTGSYPYRQRQRGL